jgi:DNA repair exonuclease SbcCD ATPase subunit
MLVLEHRSGRKHYKPKSHYIWGCSIEEWEDIQEALNNQGNRENFLEKNKNEKKSIAQLLGYLQQKKKEELEKKIQELEQKVDCVPEEYKLLDDLREQLRRLNNDQEYSEKENIDYENWTREQFIAEIERLKVENEWLKKNQTLTSSEREERIQQNQQKIAQITSYVDANSQLTNSSNNFPASLAIGGIGIIALLGLIIVKKNKMKKCNQQ